MKIFKVIILIVTTLITTSYCYISNHELDWGVFVVGHNGHIQVNSPIDVGCNIEIDGEELKHAKVTLEYKKYRQGEESVVIQEPWEDIPGLQSVVLDEIDDDEHSYLATLVIKEPGVYTMRLTAKKGAIIETTDLGPVQVE